MGKASKQVDWSWRENNNTVKYYSECLREEAFSKAKVKSGLNLDYFTLAKHIADEKGIEYTEISQLAADSLIGQYVGMRISESIKLYQKSLYKSRKTKKKGSKRQKKREQRQEKRLKSKPKRADNFYKSKEWRALRFKALVKYGNQCMCCGRQPPDVIIHVDHIKSRYNYPELELDINNLQILCADCNLGKSYKYNTDFRLTSDERYDLELLKKIPERF